jgi:GT2 family glycosyltransferase
VRSEFPQVQLISRAVRTFAGPARNIGIHATRGEYCLMIDSDCIADASLVERAIKRHLSGAYAAVGGSLRNGTPRSLIGWIGYLMEFKEFMPSSASREVASVPSANVCYRREVLERYGGFDESMQLAEDISLHWKMHKAGETIFFDPSIEVVHLNRTGWAQVLMYQVSLGRFSARARRSGNMPGGTLLRHPYLIVLMPIARTVRALLWLAANDLAGCALFLVAWPLYFLAASFWSVGFFQEAIAGEHYEVASS